MKIILNQILKISAILLFTICYLPSGLNAGIFEHLGGGARSAGMGNTGVALSNDSSSVFFNPACLMNVRRSEFSASRYDLYAMGLINYDNIFYVHPGVGWGNVGFGLLRTGTTSKVDFLDFNENTFIFSFAMKAPYMYYGRLSLGANIKYYRADLETTGTGYGVDLGVHYRIKDLHLGVMCQDINWPEVYFQSGSGDIIPSNLRVGVGYMLNDTITLEADWDNFKYNTQFYGGAEIMILRKILALRAGSIKHHSDSWTYTTGLGISAGDLRFDYGLKKHFDLDITHSFALVIKVR